LEKDLLKKILATLRNSNEIQVFDQVFEQRPCRAFKVLSANLCHPWPRLQGGEERLERFLRLVQDHRAELLILQEVWQTRRHQVHQILAEKLGMNAIYARTNGSRWQIGFEEGLAVLSRYPLVPKGLKVFRSSLHPLARRQALAVSVVTPCGELFAVSTHLSITPWRNRHQIKELIAWVESQSSAAIIGGDFNAAESTPRMEWLRKRWLDTLRHIHPLHPDPSTHRISFSIFGELRHRLDYLFLYQQEGHWRVLNAGKDGRFAFSDHAAVWVQLEQRAAFA
jgi:endonuclease/exonuclease/phosphatase family metal-dependent hydrolase